MKERTEEHNSTRGELEERGEQRRGLSYKKKKKRLSFTHERREKKEQKKSFFSPPGRSVKPNQCLVWQRCSSPRHRLTMEASLGRHTSHFQSASSRTGLRARGPRGKGQQCTPNVQILIKNLRVVRIGLTSKSKRKKKKALPQVALDRFTLIRTANIGYFIVGGSRRKCGLG